ncbi:hypothetical protein [Nitrosomonas ureae]|uniref:Uncharacterized protein n=1 Tax=Nitrosomonas ureae TaxID=44577 RepID=A0A1H2EPP6_9PROT|nr:hypothetical protein [Nitrosomonas ureae]ALQ51882.1 hypothetical protein ATY38_12040 [Nitrosomonas ureae]SDT97142.1 hypothetical protein SAMN05216406_11463 [Nitrosomonas ureae]
MQKNELNEVEIVLAKILNYQNEPEAFDHPDVYPEWREHKWLPYDIYQRFVKKTIIDYLDSINSPVHQELRERIKLRWKENDEADKLNQEEP